MINKYAMTLTGEEYARMRMAVLNEIAKRENEIKQGTSQDPEYSREVITCLYGLIKEERITKS